MKSHSKILVCGASGGIGQEFIQLIQFDKIKIVGAYNNEYPKLSHVENLILEQVDFRDLDSSKAFFAKHNDSTGMVLAAGVANPQLIGSINTEEVIEAIKVNLVSNIIALNEILPTMVRNGFGRVILIGSIVSRDGGIGLSTYSSTKSALLGLVKTANKEVRAMKEKLNPQADVTINLLSPGYVDTSLTRNAPPKIINKVKENSNSKRLIPAQEIALTLRWMLNGLPSFTNANLEINDGQHLC